MISPGTIPSFYAKSCTLAAFPLELEETPHYGKRSDNRFLDFTVDSNVALITNTLVQSRIVSQALWNNMRNRGSVIAVAVNAGTHGSPLRIESSEICRGLGEISNNCLNLLQRQKNRMYLRQ